jgi:NADH pyrophosphatase NudC (nudix superfamily)
MLISTTEPSRPSSSPACSRRQALSFRLLVWMLFPRIEPAVIVLVEHDDRCLLARHHGAPEGAYSTLAGFVEVGESLEDAVHREVREEARWFTRDEIQDLRRQAKRTDSIERFLIDNWLTADRTAGHTGTDPATTAHTS